MTPSYSRAERDRRWDMARELMDAEEVEALVVYGEPDRTAGAPFSPDAYFTDGRPGSIVVFHRDYTPLCLVPSPLSIVEDIEARRRGEQCWIDPRDIRVGRHAPGLIGALTYLGLDRAAIGVIGLESNPAFHFAPAVPHWLWSAVRDALPQATFIPVTTAFLLRAMPQSEEELAMTAHAAAIGEAMVEALAAVAGVGVTEAELCAAVAAEGLRRGGTPALLLRTGRAPISLGSPTWGYRPRPQRRLEDGDVAVAEVLSRFGMRESRHPVTIAVGAVDDAVRRAADIAHQAYLAGLATLRPGATFGALIEAMHTSLSASNAWNIHPVAHSINPYGASGGFGDGLRRLPETREYGAFDAIPTIGSDLPLVPGMTFTLAPDCNVDGHLAAVGGTVVVGEAEPIELGGLGRSLIRV